MGKSVIGAVAGEMWEPAFGAGFQAPRANQDSQVSCSFQPHWARHFHGKAANFAHFLRNRVFDLPEGLKSSFSRKPPKMHPSSDSCAEPSFPFTNRVRVCFTQNYRNEAILVNGPTTIVQTCTLVERQTCRRIQQITVNCVGLAENRAQ